MKRLFAALFLTFCPLIAQAAPPISASLLSLGAQQFVNQFWAKWSSPNRVALPYIQSVISDPVTFLGTSMSARAYMAEQTKFARRWPVRRYTPEPGTEHVSCDQAQGTCRVDGRVSWGAWRSVVSSSGAADFTFILNVNSHNGVPTFRVSAVSSTILVRIVQQPLGPISTELTQAEADDLRALVASNPATGQADQQDYQAQSPPSDNAAIQKLGCAADDTGTVVHQGCALVTALDLTSPFHTKSHWSFLILQGPPADGSGFFSFCFLEDNSATCQHSDQSSLSPAIGFDQNEFVDTSVVNLKPDDQDPLLVETGVNCPGTCGYPAVFHYIWSYNPRQQRFALIWTNVTDGLEELRFMSDGPLAGDIIVTHDDPTGHWPWPWGISVFKYEYPGKFVNILNFIGKAVQAGDTPGPDDVIDIDMPEILHRLHLQQ